MHRRQDEGQAGEFQRLLVQGIGGPDRRIDAPVDLEGQVFHACSGRPRAGRRRPGTFALEAEAAQPRRRQDEMGMATGHGLDLGRRCIVQILDADHERAAFRAVDHHGAGAAELHDRPLDQGRGGIVGQAQAQAHHRITQANRLKSGGRRRSFGAKRPQSHASGLFSPYHRALPIPNSIDAMAAMPDQWVCLQRSLGSTA